MENSFYFNGFKFLNKKNPHSLSSLQYTKFFSLQYLFSFEVVEKTCNLNEVFW